MAFRTADRVREFSSSTGTGVFTVTGSPVTYRTFSSVMSIADQCYYVIQHAELNEWEVGFGTYSALNTITRGLIYSSSNANAVVNFSAGVKDVFMSVPAEKFLQLDSVGSTYGNFTAGTITATLSGNASSASTLATGRTIGMTGDVSWTSASFNGSGNVTGTSTLATVTDSGVGTLKKITVDTKGRVTGTAAVTSSDITTVISGAYVPLSNGGNAAQIDGYIDGAVQFLATNSASTPNADAGYVAGNTALTNLGIFRYIAPGNTQGGLKVADSAVVLTQGAAGGLVLGTLSSAPVIFGTNNIERARIDTSGRLLIGTTTQISTSTDQIQILAAGNPGISIASSIQAVTNNRIFRLSAWGYDGTTYVPGATINIRAEENWSATNHGTAFQFRTIAAGSGGILTEKVCISSIGNVGIATATPETRLHISSTGSTVPAGGSQILITGDENKERMDIRSSVAPVYRAARCEGTYAAPTAVTAGAGLGYYHFGGYADTMWASGAGISGVAAATWSDTSTPANIEFQTKPIGTTAWNTRMIISSEGNVGINITPSGSYKLEVNGSFAATSKSFKIPHPTGKSRFLVYGSLESPYHGVRLTGKNYVQSGMCKVELPEYIGTLCSVEGVTIQLTNYKHGKTLWVEEINLEENYFLVKGDFSKWFDSEINTYQFFWSLTAIRKDIDPLNVEQN